MREPAVHTTEIKAFLACRLQWFWSAPPPRGLYLERGIPQQALQLGRLVHAALQVHYDTGVSAAAVFITLAVKAQEALEKEYGKLWPEQLEAMRQDVVLGAAMLRGYEEWASARDTFRVLATETSWELPLGGRKRLAGRYDLPIERHDGLWIMDFKTTKYTTTDWTTQDLQATVYLWAARKIYGPDVRGIIFRFLRKRAPDTYPQLVLKSGKLTKKKSLVSGTTYKEYARAVAIAAMQEVTDFGPDKCEELLMQDVQVEGFEEVHTTLRKRYWDVLNALQDVPNPFFWDVEEDRTPQELDNYMKYVVLPAVKEMTSRRKGRWIGPTGLGTAFTTCRRCAFKQPCRAAMGGADFRSLLQEDYKLREAYEKD